MTSDTRDSHGCPRAKSAGPWRGPLVALCDPRASKHDQAVGQLVGFVADALCTCDAALTEACFHLPRAFQRQRLRALLDRLDIGPPPVAYGREFWREALDWLTKYGQHDPD